MAITINPDRIAQLAAKEEAELDAKLQKSKAMYEQARKHLSHGVASSYQLREPWPIYIDHGKGDRITDVDGNEYYDFHNGFGAMIQGHANPAIFEAVKEQFPKGTHFAATTENIIEVADNLAGRWKLPKWRFTNSGSESTMDAIRIARGYTGRDTIMKIFGSYHGHHDAVMISIGEEYNDIGDHYHMNSLPYGAGIPKDLVPLTVPVPFNDADAMERRIKELDAEGRLPACVIMEAAMMNLGVVLPEPGYLEAVREITRKYGVVLIFDEVKTGLCIAAAGATERFGVTPDIVTLAKALGGGLPMGAIGGTEEIMSVVESGKVNQVGTYSGNPLSAAAALASLTEVLTPQAYEHLDMLNDRIVSGCERVLKKYDLPGYAVGIGSKGCVTFSDTKVIDYETYKLHQSADLNHLCWLYNMNRGVFMTPGREEEWTLSVTHTPEAIDAYVDSFEAMARDLTA